MSFEQLMQDAKNIREQAAKLLARERSGTAGVYKAEDFMPGLAYIEPLFEPFSRLPHPDKYNPLIADLTAAMQQLMTQSTPVTKLSQDVKFVETHLDKVTTTDGAYLHDWTGAAATAFKANFLDTFRTISGNQFTALSMMKGVLEAHQEMWRKARTDIDKIAHDTLDVFANAGSCNKADVTFEFSVLSAVGTTLAAIITIATGGATAPVVAIGAAAAVGNAGIAGKATVNASTVSSVLNSMKQAVADLTEYINDVEAQQMADRVRALNEAMHANKDLLVSARPRLAGMSDRDLVGDDGIGHTG
ncbi:hypothetical protein [Nocardia suismassiliense]|uniref:hypothetical protein n=1 Tax=Nocardia suismassiliense TaxID=2077092 RepID=UPI000D1EF8FD|nr:hypothetical protein [Nocardia suismassiliense]